MVATAELVPAVVLGIPLGALVTRVGGRRWMIWSDLVSAGLVCAIAGLSAAHLLPLPCLLVLVFAFGALRTPYMGSQQEVLAAVAGQSQELLARSASILQSASRASVLVGPPTAGLLIALLGAGNTMFVTVVILVAVVLTIRWGVPPIPAPPVTTGQGIHILDGVKQLRRDPLMVWWVPTSALSEAAYQMLLVTMPILTIQRYHATATVTGVLLGAFGGGAMLGSAAAALLVRHVRPLRLAVSGRCLQGLLFAALVIPFPLAWAVVTFAALGASNGLTNGPSAAVQIPRIAPAFRGSALTAIASITMGGGAVGSAIAGPTIGRSTEAMFIVAAALATTGVVFYLNGARRENLSPTQ